MASTIKTPGGVYIEETYTFPSAITQVSTAVPAFIGICEKAEKDGQCLLNNPLKIKSFSEFTHYFGGPRALTPGAIKIILNQQQHYQVSDVTINHSCTAYLYNTVRLFFDNGGSECYIIAAGLYNNKDGSPTSVTISLLAAALLAAEKTPDISLLAMPDAVLVEKRHETDLYQLQQIALEQCANQPNRFAVLDLYEAGNDTITEAATNFKQNIGSRHLSYGAAYSPWLTHQYNIPIPVTSISQYLYELDGKTTIPLTALLNSEELLLLDEIKLAHQNADTIQQLYYAIADAAQDGHIPAVGKWPLKAASPACRFQQLAAHLSRATAAETGTHFKNLLNFVRNSLFSFSRVIVPGAGEEMDDACQLLFNTANQLIGIEKNTSVWHYSGITSVAEVDNLYLQQVTTVSCLHAPNFFTSNDKEYTHPTNQSLAQQDLWLVFRSLHTLLLQLLTAAKTRLVEKEAKLYQQQPVVKSIVEALQLRLCKIPACGAVVGNYVKTDVEKGVWKTPANWRLNCVKGPSIQINNHLQELFSIDIAEGKSINVIKEISGGGTIIWGGRTLAGNDNEWKYICVRRFCSMVKESCRQSTQQFVFEPNDASTWIRIRAIIENYLTVLWRQGALIGAKPEQAFYVSAGLGKTMMVTDVLEGRLIVEIGLALIKPAEFIIIRFMHQMHTS